MADSQIGGPTFRIAPDPEQASRLAATVVAGQIKRKPESVLCFASGSTPTRTYEVLADMAASEEFSTELLSAVKLDEWLGLPLGDSHTCENYLRRLVLNPLKVSPDRYIGFDSQSTDANSECQRIERAVDDVGGIDLMILGVGVNGHLGLNEPAGELQLGCHVADLAPTTRGHSMLKGAAKDVVQGLTMGIRNILAARQIILLAFGEHKTALVRDLQSRRVSTHFPASFLWLHSDMTCFCDRDAAPDLPLAD